MPAEDVYRQHPLSMQRSWWWGDARRRAPKGHSCLLSPRAFDRDR